MGIRRPSRASLKRWLWDAVLLLAVFLAIQAWQQRDVAEGPAPATVGSLADGQAFDLATWRASHPGRPVALHFWAEWCPICTTEEGSITSVSEDWPVMTVAMQSGTANQVASHLDKKGLTWPALVDLDGRIAAAYGLKGVPAFVVIGPEGGIRSVSTGYTSELGMRLRLWWAGRF
ncbi:MAG: protein disulfide oxidoreductase [Hydrogenophilaceae bacterium]